jgi:hypothetical protein
VILQFLVKIIMRKFLLAGMVILFLSACGSGSNAGNGDSTHMGGGDHMSGSGPGGNTNHIGTDTMRGMTRDTSKSR